LAEPGGQIAAATGDPARFAEAHAALRRESAIQFELTPFQPPEVPGWLLWLGRLLEGTGPFFQILFWIILAAVALWLIYLIVRWAEGGGLAFLRRSRLAPDEDEAADWRPDQAPARALLGEADALAAAGRYAEAAHLLLFRSIEDIEKKRPALVRPALTSRDIAGAPQLPPGPRSAFGRIVSAVERSLFGGRALAEIDWRDCRAAYEEFAFAREWRD
jgi:hypothetical protein